MPALWRIVQDDCPPLPDSISPIVRDFLMHCFQKDCNLRISAKKLLRHPWMVSARRQFGGSEDTDDTLQPRDTRRNGGAPRTPDRRHPSGSAADGAKRPLSNYNFDEAVLKVQEWNEALKCEPPRLTSYQTRAHPHLSSIKAIQASRSWAPTPSCFPTDITYSCCSHRGQRDRSHGSIPFSMENGTKQLSVRLQILRRIGG